jgi:D-proline reductase (dithiol) PrdB|tara:strand:- start:237 stop:692 length:456 start_codon:yes stop_codon:yes gene_type:complete
MVLIPEMPAIGRGFISRLEKYTFDNPAWSVPKEASSRRVSIVSSAAISKRGDKPFSWLANNHRVIEKDNLDLVMTHVAVEYDRTAWQQDINTILPIDRLEEMAKNNEIGSVSNEHYSFIGSSDPIKMERSAKEVAERMKDDAVDTVFLVPV